MKIDGKLIAQILKDQLKLQTSILSQKGTVPHLAVILIGDNPSSIAYINQKKKVAEEIGVKLSLYNLLPSVQTLELLNLVQNLNTDPNVHGIIIQRPVPIEISKEQLDKMVIPSKDVDGFHPETTFSAPVANAVFKIIQWIGNDISTNPDSPLKTLFPDTFPIWFSKQKFLVIGRGETAGIPITNMLLKKGITPSVAHSGTKYMDALIKSADIVISCVGKNNIVRHQDISGKTILIGVGLFSENGKLKTDYDQNEVEKIAAYFTPVPGGVGPVNVACLFENLLTAAESL